VETTDLIKKLRKIEIRTKGLSNQVFAGEYHSAFRGKGISFSEVREYNFGDDIRNIDWKMRRAEYLCKLPDKAFEEVTEKILSLLVK